MNFKEITSRLTGLSCPVFGVNWNPLESEISIARRVVAYMENRRVLFVPHEVEVPEHCVQSILEIRQFLTDEIGALTDSESISEHLRAMRLACIAFMNRVQPGRRDIVEFATVQGHYTSWEFMDALGQMRGVFGIHLAQLAAKHGLSVEDGLARIFPSPGTDG